MKSKRNIFIVLSIVLIVVITGIFATMKLVSFAGDYQKSIYNDNTKIISQADSYTFLTNNSNINGNTVTESFNKFTGMVTVYNLKADLESTIKIDFKSTISNGDFKIVLIDPNDNVTDILEQSSSVEQEIAISSGESRIKIVGYNAKGNIDLSVSSIDDVKIAAKDQD